MYESPRNRELMKMTNPPTTFSAYTLPQAFQKLGVETLQPWQIESEPFKPSDFFHKRLERLNSFDLAITE